MSADTAGNRSVRAIALAVTAGVFLGGVATGVAFPTLPLLGEYLGISASLLGFILAANRIARLLANTPAGNVIDRVGPRRPMIVGLFVQGLAPFGYVAGLMVPRIELFTLPAVGVVSLPALVFIGARVFWGLGSAFVFIGAFAIITGVTERSNRGRWTGYMRAGQSMGFPTGLVVGGIVADVFDITTAFLAAGTLALAAGVLGWYVLPDVSPNRKDGRTPRLRDLPATVRSIPGVLPVGLANTGVRLLFGGVLLTTAVQYADALGLTIGSLTAAGVSGLVTGLGVVASAGATVVSGRVSDSVESRAVVAIPGFGLLAVGYAILALVGTLTGVTAGIALVGAGTGAVGPALLATLGDIAPGDEVGRLGGVYNVFGDIGLSVGPLAALPVAAAIGFKTTYLACAGIALACLLLVNATLLKT